MTQEHPITPPPELIQHWLGNYFGCIVSGELSPSENFLATQAARWGADQELDACCAWVSQWRCMVGGNRPEIGLRATRRPQPQSLKELNLKHLEVMERDGHYLPEIIADLRRAIESLPS